MPESLTADQQIALAAFTAAGASTGYASQTEWLGNVQRHAGEIALALEDGSDLMTHINELRSSQAFIATILGGKSEKSSNRVLVRFIAENGKEEETIRTPRLDTVEGQALREQARALKGHRVLLRKFMQEGKDGRKYRLLTHITDLEPTVTSQTPPQQAEGDPSQEA